MMRTIGKIFFTILLAFVFISMSAQGQRKKALTIDEVIHDFNDYIETIPFYSSELIKEEHDQVESHVNALRNWKDKEAYIAEHQLNTYVNANRDTIDVYRNNSSSFVTKFLSRYGNRDFREKDKCIDSIHIIINKKLESREYNLNILADELNIEGEDKSFNWKNINWKSIGWKDLKKFDLQMVGAGVVLLIILFALIIWFKKANRKGTKTRVEKNMPIASDEASPNIVVRRKTTSILRKQSLDDVIDNDAYMVINCSDFAGSTAVRKMYIKNTCIKDIYNMYAEDLRNPENPKEDGCMVLGRWVHDKDNDEYYVSLEHIVLPGDDAIFSEYELNFGGKIKLKVTERLRKLRRDTNLQYDLTCWVHSHPGLGVFFSNSDENVQMQLKHPTHPNFLTAIVVDILTPQQEMGIFTFKKDGTLNSKSDLKKMYSLEELYKWAVESDRNSFKPEDHYNTLEPAKSHYDNCYGIELSNSAIIDMGMLAAEQNTGFIGMIHGYQNKSGLHTEFVAATITKTEAVPDNELIGCFVTATHCSIPSIRKLIASYLGKIQFVLVYTASDDLLTSIPVVNQDLCTDGNYYGEQKLEHLKIWTRRKR